MVNKNARLQLVLSLWGFKENLEIKEENIEYETKRESHIWTVSEDYILKMTNSEYEIKNNVYISRLLLKAGIPTQKVVCTLDGESYASVGNRYYALFIKIKGEVLKDYYQGNYIKNGFYLGECIAELHDGLRNITHELKENNSLWDNNMIEELDGWVEKEISRYIPKCTLNKEKLENFNRIRIELNENFKELYLKLPRQIIHRDIHGENMIFKDNNLVGYIDFDLTQINARIFDLCYLCTGALAKVFDEKDKREKWLDFSKAVINGYESKSEMTIEEKCSIKYMFYSIELIMIAFFARDGYTELAENNIKMINWISLVLDNSKINLFV
ncbi:phosphotransferase enzyme family protein [Clostridium hydrogeniformans]|uniref:phosphotransferase enzyme family protein n=1 Tax=Clostridium hydrogeniformans TaxID=349933 RepID=UPI00068D8FD2|nr:phosphotransferase [Clostridium hydrogeniformans]